jgi:hypothetical protein
MEKMKNNNNLSVKSKNGVYITVTGGSKSNLCGLYSKKTLTFISLLLITALVFSPLISIGNGAEVVSDVVIGNEYELLKAISTAPNKKSYVIGISENIALKNLLEIPNGKNITLVMNCGTSSFVSVIGTNGVDTVIVKSGGSLVLLDGVVITHVKGDRGRGVYVESRGTLIIDGGKISGNTVNGTGGGVYNAGSFVMSGGVISDNTASSDGGGVYNDVSGSFVMSGGEISRNTAPYGGGVQYFSGSVKGTFTLSGGKIFNNTATSGSGDHGDLSVVCVDSAAHLKFYHLFIVIVVVVVIGVLLVYRSKKRKHSLRNALVGGSVVV